jgi:hemolysin D
MKSAEVVPLRKADASPRRRGAELEFLPAAVEIIETPASPAGRASAIALVLFLVIAIAWAWFGRVDVIASAPGRIVPAGKVKVLQPLEAGIVSAIHVQDGDHVTAGQVLVELDPTTVRADRDSSSRELLQARLDVARLTALLDDVKTGKGPGAFVPPPDAPPLAVETARAGMVAQAAEQASKLAGIDQQIVEKRAEAQEASALIDKLKASLPFLQERVDLRQQLLEVQYSNRFAYLEAQQQLVEAQHDLVVETQRLREAGAARAALEKNREQARAEYAHSVLDDLGKAQQKADEEAQQLAKAAEKTNETVLKAPVDGMVQQLAVHTVGGVVTPAQPLLVVVPDDHPLVVEAMVRNDDVGFVHVGQEVEVKVETFNFTRYGLIHGQVASLSRAALDDEGRRPDPNATPSPETRQNAEPDHATPPAYVAQVSLDKNAIMVEGTQRPLGPGMAVTAEIKTGRRRILEYLLSPLVRQVEESLHER